MLTPYLFIRHYIQCLRAAGGGASMQSYPPLDSHHSCSLLHPITMQNHMPAPPACIIKSFPHPTHLMCLFNYPSWKKPFPDLNNYNMEVRTHLFYFIHLKHTPNFIFPILTPAILFLSKIMPSSNYLNVNVSILTLWLSQL